MSITRTQDQITPSLGNIVKGINKFPQQALQKVIKLTPVKTGYARQHTKLVQNKTITGDYSYAGALNEGKSRQAPDGIVKPFIPWAEDTVLKIITGGTLHG
jgi:hypothetical protein